MSADVDESRRETGEEAAGGETSSDGDIRATIDDEVSGELGYLGDVLAGTEPAASADQPVTEPGEGAELGEKTASGEQPRGGEEREPGGAAVERAAVAEEALAAARAAIPAPTLGAKPKPERRGFDALTALAMLFFVAVGGLLVFGFAQALGPAAEAQLGAACRPLNPEPREGAAPTLDLEDLEGNPVSLADFGGKFLIVNFWATWCEPCTREWPDLDQLAERLADRDDVVIVAVGVDQDKAEIGPYLERMGLSDTKVRVLWAKGAAAHEAFGSEKLPDTYFVDREGQLQSVFVNVRAWGKAAAFRCVESMI